MPSDLYIQIRRELSVLVTLLKKLHGSPGPKEEQEVQGALSKIHRLSVKIGGQLQYDVELLKSNLEHLFVGEYTLDDLHAFLEHALQLERETREL